MLYNMKWLEPGQSFPPMVERARIKRYLENEVLFDGEHFGDELRDRNKIYNVEGSIAVYRKCAERISQVVGNFEDIISFPVLLNYQRLMSMKMADLVCGEYPTITGASEAENDAIKTARDTSDFDAQLYSTVIDMSRYGDAIWREYLDEDTGNKTFTLWDPKEWFPIVRDDGTNRISHHVLCWRVNLNAGLDIPPVYELHVQIHGCTKADWGHYESRVYSLNGSGDVIMDLMHSEVVNTGFDHCAVQHLKAFSTSSTVYGYDDYMPLDSILAEIMARIGQISIILDKHADPNMTGPVTMLSQNPHTGEYYLKRGKFFATSQGDNEPKYLTWDGQLTAAFKQLEVLINQMYILSEMGAAILGGEDGSSAAISGTAMRFKMVNPLAKARRISNSLTNPARRLLSALAEDVDFESISVYWADGLPDDPRENIENAKLATGETRMMPLKVAIREFFQRSDREADEWIKSIDDEKLKAQTMFQTGSTSSDDDDPNHPGPQNGTGVNPQRKGSETGLTNFHGTQNSTNASES